MAKDFALIKRAIRQEFDPRNFGAIGDGATNDTAAVQAAIDEAIEAHGAVDLGGRDYLVDTLVFDGSNFEIRGPGSLIASSNIPASGAILLSLAGGGDETVNQALLDGIYGTDVYLVRSNVPNSMEGVHIFSVTFEGNANDIRGIWATGFTRGCFIMGCLFDGLDGDAVALNGSWSFAIICNHFNGDGTNGTGISLGRIGNGERSGAIIANAALIIGNEVTGHDNGMIWNFGSGGEVSGNTFEQNVTDGFASQSVSGLVVQGNYFESNDVDNLDMGGTNGTDFAEGWTVQGNFFNNSSGNQIRLDGVKDSIIGPNYFGGSVTQQYIIGSGNGVNVLNNTIYVGNLNSTFITNPEELDASTNNIIHPHGKRARNIQNGNYTFTLHDPAMFVVKQSGGAGETWTIPANSSVPFQVGSVLEGVNNGGGTLTIAITTDTLNSTLGTGSRTIADGGRFRIIKTDTTAWTIEGSGIT